MFSREQDYTSEERIHQQEVARRQIPDLLEKGLPSADLLQKLHTEATKGTQIPPHPQVVMGEILQALNYPFSHIGRILGNYPLNFVREQLEEDGRVKFVSENEDPYRKIAILYPEHIDPNHRINLYKSLTLNTNVTGIRNPSETQLFIPPIYEVEELMNTSLSRFEETAGIKKSDEFFQSLARTYLEGLGFIHPFSDGNDRAFRLFVEAECQRRGVRVNFSGLEDWRGKIAHETRLGSAPARYSVAFNRAYSIPTYPREALRTGEYFDDGYYKVTLPNFKEGIRENLQSSLQQIVDETVREFKAHVVK